LHDLSDKDLLRALARLNGAPAEVLADGEVMRLLLPVVRADLRLAEQWEFTPAEPLSVPVSLLSGRADPLAPAAEMAGWRAHFTGETVVREYDGDHFFIHGQRDVLLRDIAIALSGGLR
jgi:medium-chain acyl-[acyl-carrier-protein] hydrolase